MEDRCLHKRVVRTIRTVYYFPNGWEQDVEENDDCDLADYEVVIESCQYRCQDCGKVLDEM